jgi:capsular exopolysaccharide synthesis family protein
MSQIFDALQRSETERAGSENQTSLEPADVLRRAERYAATKWESESSHENVESFEIGDSGAAGGRESIDVRSSREHLSSAVLNGKTDERQRILSQCQTLPFSAAAESRMVSITDQGSPAAEAFRLLGVRLRDIGRIRPLKRVLITSTIPQEGKTTVALNLACTLARSTQQRVLLLEGDVRRPALSQMLGIEGNPGICEWLKGDQSPVSSIYHLREPGFWIMPAGSPPENPLEMLQSVRLNALMAQLVGWFDSVIIDSPPVLPLADTSVWMRLADGIVLVVRQGTTEKKQLQRGLEAIEPQKLIGALLNCSKDAAHSLYYY